MPLTRVVQLAHKGQAFTFCADAEAPFAMAFWRVESEGRIYRSPMRVTGAEEAGFFRSLADAALNDWG